MRKHRNPAEFPLNGFDIFNYVLMAVLTIVSLFPLYYVVIISFASQASIQQHLIYALPYSISIDAYKYIMKDSLVFHSFFVSLVITIIGTLLAVLICTACAYTLSKKDIPGKKLMFLYVMIPMFFGGGLIPSYLNTKMLGLIDNLWVMILPGIVSTYYLILIKSFLEDLPPSVEESAKIDGANDLVILFRIVFPMSMPIIATMALFFAVDYWNNYFTALVYITNQNLMPLQTVLYQIMSNFNSVMASQTGAAIAADNAQVYSLSLQMAVIVITTIPILCVYPFVQKYFTKGIRLGAVKG